MKPIKPSENLLKQIEEYEKKKPKSNMESKIMLMANSAISELPEYFIRVDHVKDMKNPDTAIKSALMVKGEEQPAVDLDADGRQIESEPTKPESMDLGLEFWQIRNLEVPYFVSKRQHMDNLKELIETEKKHNIESHRAKDELKVVRDRYNFLIETRKVSLTEMRDRIKHSMVLFLKRD